MYVMYVCMYVCVGSLTILVDSDNLETQLLTSYSHCDEVYLTFVGGKVLEVEFIFIDNCVYVCMYVMYVCKYECKELNKCIYWTLLG